MAALASLALVVAGAGSASADSSKQIYDSKGNMLGWGYFKSYGERFGVYDNWPDYHSVVVQWYTANQSGKCWDSNGSANGPEECDESFGEGAKVNWRVCTADRDQAWNPIRCSGWLVDYA